MKPYLTICFLLIGGYSSYAQGYIAKDKAQADIDFYFEKLERVHYNPYTFIEKAAYDAAIADMKQRLPDSLTVTDLTRRFYTLTAKLQDGHTAPNFIQPALRTDLKQAMFFPYRLVFDEGTPYISRSVSDSTGIPAGARLLMINGKDATQLHGAFKGYIGGHDAFKAEMAERLFPYFLYLNGVVAPFTIYYNSPDGKTGTYEESNGVTFMESLERYLPHLMKGNTYKVLNDTYGYIGFSSMSGNWQDWSALLGQALDTFRTKNITNLVVDLRENSGGNSLFGEVLFGFITDKPFLFQSRREWKISQEYKDYLLENGNTEHDYLQQENGSVMTLQNCDPRKSRMEVDQPFTGKVYILTGPFTFSSGHMVADAAKEFGLATLVGQPTGEHTIDFGEVLSLTLPNSGIVINYSTAMDYGSDCETTDYTPVMPDITVVPDLQSKVAERDSVLDYILSNK